MNHFLIRYLILFFITISIASGQVIKNGRICIIHNSTNRLGTSLRLKWQNNTYTIENKDTCITVKVLNRDESYFLLLEGEGYYTETKNGKISELSNHFYFEITLRDKIQQLKEVVIKSKNGLYYQGDTLIIKTDSIITRPHSDANELLGKIPGITLHGNGRIEVMGKPVDIITINGKQFFGGNPKTTLQILKSEMIKQLEVIENTNSSGDKTVSLNLKLKEGRQNGMYGSAEASYGNPKSYNNSVYFNKIKPDQYLNFFLIKNNINKNGFSPQTESNISQRAFTNFNGAYSVTDLVENRFTKEYDRRFTIYESAEQEGVGQITGTGINFNKSTPKQEWFGFATLDKTKRKVYQESKLTNNLNNSLLNEQINSTIDRNLLNAQATLMSSVKLNQNNQLKFTANIIARNRQITDYKHTYTEFIINNDSIKSELQHSNYQKDVNFSTSQQALWVHRYKKPANLTSLYLSHYYSMNRLEQTYQNTLNSFNRFINNHNSLNNHSHEQYIETQIVHDWPLNRKWLVEFKGSLVYENNLKIQNRFQILENSTLQRPDLSIHPFHIQDWQEALHINLFYKKDNLNFVAGLNTWNWQGYRVNNSADANYSKTRILPKVNIQYLFKNASKLSLMYNQTNRLPDVNMLFPLVDSSNIQEVKFGNSHLSYYFNHAIEVNYNLLLKKKHNLTFNSKYTVYNNNIISMNEYNNLGYASSTYTQAGYKNSLTLSAMWINFAPQTRINTYILNFFNIINTPLILNSKFIQYTNYIYFNSGVLILKGLIILVLILNGEIHFLKQINRLLLITCIILC
ncbi:MAG: outer membrane beta-barrel protein [Siphonobacter sp.]